MSTLREAAQQALECKRLADNYAGACAGCDPGEFAAKERGELFAAIDKLATLTQPYDPIVSKTVADTTPVNVESLPVKIQVNSNANEGRILVAQPETRATCDHDKAQPVAWRLRKDGETYGMTCYDYEQVETYQSQGWRLILELYAAPQLPAEQGAELRRLAQAAREPIFHPAVTATRVSTSWTPHQSKSGRVSLLRSSQHVEVQHDHRPRNSDPACSRSRVHGKYGSA